MSDYPKKLIEVALPLEDINAASAREKSIRHGHPSTLHLWWARRPLAAARAVLFAQLVDDPSGYVGELMEDPRAIKAAEKALGRKHRGEGDLAIEGLLVEAERERLFDLVRQLVIWENTTNDAVLEPARNEILRSWRRTCTRHGKPKDTPLPPFLDPFAGGGAIPLEAQRLGLVSNASDLNPVAALINKAMLEIPAKFVDVQPKHPDAPRRLGTENYKGTSGLAEDVLHYGQWLRDEAFKQIGHLYPPYKLTEEVLNERPDLVDLGYKSGDELTVIAWLWARTIPSPNPALGGVEVPLISTFYVSAKKGKEVWIEPLIDNDNYSFKIHIGKPDDHEKIRAGTKTGRGEFRCLLSGVPIDTKSIREAGKKGKIGSRLLAVVCEGPKGRLYLPGCRHHEKAASLEGPDWEPTQKLPIRALGFRVQNYGMHEWRDLFSQRQKCALETFSSIVREFPKTHQEAIPTDYGVALATYLGLAVSRLTQYWSNLSTWHNAGEKLQPVFGRQAIPMVWDYCEVNPFCSSSGNWIGSRDWVSKAIKTLSGKNTGKVYQRDAASQIEFGSDQIILSTDPPYYDNVPYADLSDFFYIWMRRMLAPYYPDVFETILTPKSPELIADPFRRGGTEGARKFFEEGMTNCFRKVHDAISPDFPVTIFYAFKQTESSTTTDIGQSSKGWETFLEGLLEAGFFISGTWPMRTEMAARVRGRNSNALASSIVLSCRQRPNDAPTATRRDFIQEIQRELPSALRNLQYGNIAPVDLPQSSIGPGMAIFSRNSKVVEADGTSMSVRTALQIINAEVSNILEGQIAEMDDWTRFSVSWFSSYGFSVGKFGDAATIATAFNVSVDGVAQAGIIESGQGKVRIYRPNELPADWNPDTDNRLTVWEVAHHLIRLLETQGEEAAAAVFTSGAIQAGDTSENARSLCYRLYTICEQNKWAEEATSYNGLISAWPELLKLSQTSPASYIQADLI